MKTIKLLLLLFVLPAIGCATKSSYPDRPGGAALDAIATDVLSIDFGSPIERRGTESNFSGVRSKDVLVSQRTDSRTYFVQDLRYESETGGGYRGSDEDHLAIARRMLEGLGVPASEIASAVVLTEKLQTARRDGDRYLAGPTADGKRFVEAMRQVGTLPVFSSRAFIGLTERKSPGTLEVHWPRIPDDVLRRGSQLQDMVARGWRPPVKTGGRIESVEAGVIHSPAIGFVMDIVPVIRVIVAPENADIGRKGVLYFDAEGREVPYPRTFERLDPPKNIQRASPKP
ncbi:MAG TPA: hypothetical protein VF432_32910 [Thermoanaerobaculia bacterium]